MNDAVFFGVVLFGLLHGINPSHGWIIAVLYSIQSKKPLLTSIISSGIIAVGHFLSSIAVVVAFMSVTLFVSIPHNYMNYVVATALGILAYIFWREKGEDFLKTQHGHLHDFAEETEHEHIHWHSQVGNHSHSHFHEKRILPHLKMIATTAIILGFAHEEELVILSLAVGGVNPVLLMVSYALAVATALIGITVLSVRIFEQIKHRILQYTKYLPKISSIVLVLMGIGFIIGIL